MGKKVRCQECGAPAIWIRYTQFAGNHYFCEIHAQKEEDFNKSDPTYFIWEKLSGN